MVGIWPSPSLAASGIASARLYLAGLRRCGREARAAEEKGERRSETATQDLRMMEEERVLPSSPSSECTLVGEVDELSMTVRKEAGSKLRPARVLEFSGTV